MVTYHSPNGQEFIGLRYRPHGQHQIVYDARAGKRVLLTLRDSDADLNKINDALREASCSRNVLRAVMKALNHRDIRFEYPA